MICTSAGVWNHLCQHFHLTTVVTPIMPTHHKTFYLYVECDDGLMEAVFVSLAVNLLLSTVCLVVMVACVQIP